MEHDRKPAAAALLHRSWRTSAATLEPLAAGRTCFIASPRANRTAYAHNPDAASRIHLPLCNITKAGRARCNAHAYFASVGNKQKTAPRDESGNMRVPWLEILPGLNNSQAAVASGRQHSRSPSSIRRWSASPSSACPRRPKTCASTSPWRRRT